MSLLATIVVGATRKKLDWTVVDENDSPINLTGFTQAPRLQGKSDAGTPDIDMVGTVVDAPNGLVRFSSLGSLVTHANLASASVDVSTYRLSVKWWDSAGLVDFGDEFQFAWKDNPLRA